MTEILVINMMRLGDLVQSTPALQGLKRRYPQSRITLMVNQEFSQIVPALPCIDDVILFSHVKLWECLFGSSPSIEEAYAYLKDLFDGMRAKGFDLVINLTPDRLGMLASFLADGRQVSGLTVDRDGYQCASSGWVQYYLNMSKHWESSPFNLVDIMTNVAGLKPERIAPKLVVDSENADFARDFLEKEGFRDGETLVGFQLGASKPERFWPMEYFVELAETIRARHPEVRLILYGSPREQPLGEQFERHFSGPAINAMGRTDVLQLAALMARTEILVTSDTGPMHVAASTDTRIISFFMARALCMTTGPYGEGHIAIQPTIPCYPCLKAEECPDRRCKTQMTPDLVFALLENMLPEAGNPGAKGTLPEHEADVFLSGFDSNHLLDFLPLEKSRFTAPAFCTRLLRRLWPILFSEEDTGRPSLAERVDREARRLIEVVHAHYHTDEIGIVEDAWLRTMAPFLKKLIDLGGEGRTLSTGLVRIAANPIENIKQIQTVSEMLGTLDDRIEAVGESFPPFVTLTQMFLTEKDNLEGNQILSLAEQTTGLYERLIERCLVLNALGDRFFEQMRKDVRPAS